MKNISTKTDFIKYCRRSLGAPVVQINVTDEQAFDRVDDAFNHMIEYHDDATQRTFVKYLVTDEDMANGYLDMNRGSGSVSVTAGSNTVTGVGTSFPEDMQNPDARLLIQINGETREVIDIQSRTSLTVNAAFTANASGVNVTFPETYQHWYNVVRLFPIGGSTSSASYMWDLQYQIRLNELYDFTAMSYVPYEITMQHLRTIQLLFVGDQEFRFNRRNNRLYIDASWGTKIIPNSWIVIEANRILTPETWPGLWNDRWFKKYATCLIKKQWGNNMKKYSEIALIGGVKMNGQQIFDEAVKEQEDLEEELDDLQRPPQFFVG